MVKIISLIALLLLYPLFLKLANIHDLRAIPLVIPYALGCLSVHVIGFEIVAGMRKLLRRKTDPSPDGKPHDLPGKTPAPVRGEHDAGDRAHRSSEPRD